MPSELVHPAVTDPEARAHLERLYAQPGAVPSRDADGGSADVAARVAALRRNPGSSRAFPSEFD